MRTIGLEVRKNPLVISFDVYVDAVGRTINQDEFQNVATGIYTHQEQVSQVNETLSVTLEIFGPGSNVARPTAVCLTSLDHSALSPYLATSILANKSKAAASLVYHVADSFVAGGDHEVPLLGQLTPAKLDPKATVEKKKGRQ